MNITVLEEAISEAERFLIKAKEAQKRREKDWQEDKKRLGLTNRIIYSYGSASPENASCKRASMDLTKTLARLRK